MQLQTDAAELAPPQCGLGQGLSFALGIDIQMIEDANSWLVVLGLEGAKMTVEIVAPTGERVTSKQLPVSDEACAQAIDVVAILLAAHMPQASKRSDEPAPTTRTAETPSAAPEPEALSWRLGASAGTGLSPPVAAWLGAVRGTLVYEQLAFSLQAGASYQQQQASAGDVILWSTHTRASAGWTDTLGPVVWSASLLVGLHWTVGQTRGVAQDGDGSVYSGTAGLQAEVWLPVADSFWVGGGFGLLGLWPAPVFRIRNLEERFALANPLTEARIGVEWVLP